MNTKYYIDCFQNYVSLFGEDVRLGMGLKAIDILERLERLEDCEELLDLRDEQYFEFCETGKMPEQEQK